jgi:hypothetical protein
LGNPTAKTNSQTQLPDAESAKDTQRTQK